MSDISSRYLVPTFNGLIAQIGLSAGVSIVCVGFFEWNRRKKTLQYLYSPRTRLNVNPSPPMSMRFLGWIKPTLNIPEEFYITNVGLDAVMFLRFLKMCLQFCVFNAIVVGVILLPIHYTGGNDMSEVPRMSIANIKNDSNVLWAHVILTYVVTLSWMFLLFKNYWQWMDLRREYTLQRIRQGEIAERSIFISRLPTNLRSDAALKQYFESLKMGPVESATVVQHCGRLSQKIDRRESALNMLEKAHIELAQQVLDTVKHGKFTFNGPTPTISITQQRPLLQSSPTKQDSEGAQSIDDTNTTALETTVQELYRDKKLYRKMRKSIFAHKRKMTANAAAAAASQPQLNIPLAALSAHQSDIIDVYVHGVGGEEEAMQPNGSSMSIVTPATTIWNVLAALDRSTLDRFQPTRPENRFKGGERVESIDYLVKKYNKLDRRVGELRDGSLRYKSTSFGFVTFKHHLSAQLCAQAKIDSRPQGLSVRLAMEPRDVLWSNLTASFRNRFSRSVVVNLSIWVLIIFWIFPTSSFLLLTSLGALSERFKFLRPILEASPLIQSLLQNVLPIVFVTIFLALAPVIILEISKQELPVSHSTLEGNVFRRYYHFLIFNVLFVFMIGTAILKSIITLIQQPTNIFTLLAESLPSGSTFFVFYIVFNTCTHALELVQVWAQLVIHVFVTSRKLTPTPRSLQRATTPWAFQYYYYYPQNILAMVITFIYSIISPLILIAATVYFAFALLVFKYQLAYCYIRKYETSGKFFRHVFQYTTDGLIIFQITMVGVLWLKEALVGGFFVVALMGFTVYFKILCGDLFKSRTKSLPLDTGLRNFDNDSSYNMNELPMQSAVAIVDEQSSDFMERPGLRRRNLTEREKLDDRLQATDNAPGSGLMVADAGGSGPFKDPRFFSQDYDRRDMHVNSIERLDDPVDEESGRDGYQVASDRHFASGFSIRESAQDGRAANTLDNSSGLMIHCSDDIAQASPPSSKRSSTREITLFTVGDNPTYKPKDLIAEDAEEHGYRQRDSNDGDGDDDEDDGDDDENNDELSPGTAGFLDEDGFYLDNFGVRNSRMNSRPLASHFEHTPCKHIYQDRTSDFETYIHPALLKPLNRKLWLPRNPLYLHWDLDDTVEVDFALNSSATVDKLEFRVCVGENEGIRSPQINGLQQDHHHQQQDLQDSNYVRRRNTIASNFENNMGVSMSSPSNWEGCLSDSPPNTATLTPRPPGSWDKYDEKRAYNDENSGIHFSAESPALPPSSTTVRRDSRSHQRQDEREQDALNVTRTKSHSVSTTGTRVFSPTPQHSAAASLKPPQSPHFVGHNGGDDDNIESANTRYKRSPSMPPTPLLNSHTATITPVTAEGSFSTKSPQLAPSTFLSVRRPTFGSTTSPRMNNTLPSSGQQKRQQPSSQPGSASQSPRVSFTQDATPALLNEQSQSIFSGLMSHRHTISHGQGNSVAHGQHSRYVPQQPPMPSPSSSGNAAHGIHASLGGAGSTGTGAGTGTGTNHGSGGGVLAGASLHDTLPRKNGAVRGTAGAFFSMIFGDGDNDEDNDVLGVNETPRFGYETGGMWSSRRASIDHNDDDDDDDDDDDSDDSASRRRSRDATKLGTSAGASLHHTTINMLDAGPTSPKTVNEVSITAPPTSAVRGLGELALTQPSHLDLSETMASRDVSGHSQQEHPSDIAGGQKGTKLP
ncbi:hypothetical protein BGZ99_004401 [Dissophora globulifera]|uniref:DUF221-domain-containing protein n=1 Tax=Dissophora globulifera TaxID=979702 RepID=A0A9P6RJV4_9FUNG|nr:hypothetical protein BGZ99_004401 [Dissophora globulifera]